MNVIYPSYRYYYITHNKRKWNFYGILLSQLAGIISKYFNDFDHITEAYSKQKS